MENTLESKTTVKNQHLKLQREGEEELWISGEELRTDGSSDEEVFKKNTFEKTCRKSADKRYAKSSGSSSIMKLEKKENFLAFLSDESKFRGDTISQQNLPLNWKPKRGSLQLPNLYEDPVRILDFYGGNSVSWEENKSFDVIQKNPFSYIIDSLPALKRENVRFDNKNAEIMKNLAAIHRLEQQITESADVLQNEKNERLKVEEEMCVELCNTDDIFRTNISSFINLYCSEVENFADNKQHCNDSANIEMKQHNQRRQLIKNNAKNFIRRNIELAATAMSKLPLTDEEKQHLDEILSDIDLCDSRQNSEDTNVASAAPATKMERVADEENDLLENPTLDNAFHLSTYDKKRMSEIDFELENNYSDTQHLRPTNGNNCDNFWKNLILDQTLKEIDTKLAVIKQNDKTNN